MPIYSYQCKSCGHEMDRLKELPYRERQEKCEKCGGAADFVISCGGKHPDHLYPYVDDNIAAHPIEIRSRKHYLQELKKRGLQERSGGKTARWI